MLKLPSLGEIDRGIGCRIYLCTQPADIPVPAPLEEKPASKNGHGRRQLPLQLERRPVIFDVPETQRPCPCCGTMRASMGDEISEKLDFEPAKVFVRQEIRRKYVCRACEAAATETGPQIVIAEKPSSPIEKGLAAPGLLAQIIVSKYADHNPLHRLERILGRHDIQISRSTTCDWMAGCAEALRPLYNLMVEEVLASRIIHTDDTPVDVLDRELAGRSKTGRFWVYVGDFKHPQVVFDYTPSRSRDGPMAFLKGWGKEERVYLQADAFGGYLPAGCAHANRGAPDETPRRVIAGPLVPWHNCLILHPPTTFRSQIVSPHYTRRLRPSHQRGSPYAYECFACIHYLTGSRQAAFSSFSVRAALSDLVVRSFSALLASTARSFRR